MKKLFLMAIFLPLMLLAESPIIDGDEELATINAMAENEEQPSIYEHKIQKNFFNKNRKGNENTLFIHYKKGMSYKIRTRETMITSLVFENDQIESAILGDDKGFEISKSGDNILVIKPKIIGVDTNLVIVGKSHDVYSFYIFSTTTENRLNPVLVSYIFNPSLKNAPNANSNNQNNKYGFKVPKGRTIDEYMIIGDESNRLFIDRSKIASTKYKQIAKAKIRSKSGSIYIEDEESIKLKALEIFNDHQFTYFKFDRDLASSRFPALFQVINGTNAIVNTSIVGNFLIAKTLSNKWVFKIEGSEVYIEAIE